MLILIVSIASFLEAIIEFKIEIQAKEIYYTASSGYIVTVDLVSTLSTYMWRPYVITRLTQSKNLLLYRKCRRDMNICE